MLDRPQDPETTERPDPDEGAEPEADALQRGKTKPSVFTFFVPGSLTTRIFVINMMGLVILALGILYFNQFRQSLIDARAQSLRTQAQIIAAAIAGSATADTGSIVINPDSLDDATSNLTDGDQPEGADFPINPETAGPVLRRLMANTRNRAQIIDMDGNLVVDSGFIYGGDVIEVAPTIAPPDDSFIVMRWWNALTDRVFATEYPPLKEYALDQNKERPEIAAALNGASISQVRLDDKREIVVVVTVPVQRFRAVLGALVLSNTGGEIDDVLRAERRVVLLTFGLAACVTLLLSALLAGTIASPIRRLSAAARRVRQGIAKRVEIPDFSRRRDEIGDLSTSVRDMTAALYNRIDAIEAFAADVAHELKNPLTSLRSAVETISLVKTDEQRNRLIGIVKQDVKRMDRLITDISEASRLDAELARTESEPTDVAQLIGAIVSMRNELAKEGAAHVTLTVDPPLSGQTQSEFYTVMGQASRLSQVFRNLIDNASSFTAPGTRIQIRLRRVDGEVEVRVEDSGPGIRPENLERVFERFYTDRPESSFGNNSGLGLAISRQIITAHKGRIWAENRLGRASAKGERPVQGARFVVRLPAETRVGGKGQIHARNSA